MNALKFFMAAFITVLITAGVSYVQTKQPEAIRELIIKADVFGISDVAANERQRLAQIRNLTIPFEQKKVLMERNIFMGADRVMVYLALGDPNEAKDLTSDRAYRAQAGQNANHERWIYYFKNDPLPTVLEFRDETLVSAYKGSKLDM